MDTDFSQGRLTHEQTISIKDLEKFHGHLCDGLIVGALAMQQAMTIVYPHQTIDRTNLRIVSKPSLASPMLRYTSQVPLYHCNTFYLDTAIEGLNNI